VLGACAADVAIVVDGWLFFNVVDWVVFYGWRLPLLLKSFFSRRPLRSSDNLRPTVNLNFFQILPKDGKCALYKVS
jgi:hypothetical protein